MEFINIIIYASIYIGLIATTFFILTFVADTKKKKPMYDNEELPKVSVIIPAYNEEKSIAETIKSILASDYPDFEVIVVDDGSKDDTLKIAKRFECDSVRVFHKENGGKGVALNFGIEKTKGKIIFSMDADTFVEPWSMKNMVRYFKDPKVMCVTPAMVVYKPKGVLQRLQHAEYVFGLFLRKVFAAINSIYIVPGAFSAYRKTFFDKYGGYEGGNITEDLELALRIQYYGYKTEHSPNAPAYTVAPKKFRALTVQRRRWYCGLMTNTWKYKKMIGKGYGDMGAFVMPIAWISIFFSIFIIAYLFIKTLFNLQKELLFLQHIDYDISGIFNLNLYTIERFLFLFFTNPIIIFIFVFMALLGIYTYYASNNVKMFGMMLNIPFYFAFFAVLFSFWWVVSIIYALFHKEIKWR